MIVFFNEGQNLRFTVEDLAVFSKNSLRDQSTSPATHMELLGGQETIPARHC